MHTPSCIELLNRWRRQIGCRRTSSRGPRGIGALGYLLEGKPDNEEMVALERLHFVVVYDETYALGRTAIRLASYRARLVKHGIEFGGLSNARMYKDLLLCPRPGGAQLRFDLLNTSALHLGISLNGRIDTALRHYPHVAHSELRLPSIWASFTMDVAADLTGSGPEFQSLCERFGAEPAMMLQKFRRESSGLALYPLAWVSDQLASSSGAFVDLTEFPRRQVFGVADPVVDLVGYDGAAAFDFYANHFRSNRLPVGASELDSVKPVAA